MLVYLIVMVIALTLTWLNQRGVLPNGLGFAFFSIFLFLALRYMYGNDYQGYLLAYNELVNTDDTVFYRRGNEIAWLYLNYAFKLAFDDIGFPIMIASISLLNVVVAYRFFRTYIPQPYYVFALAIYMLDPGNILVLSSAIRQSIAVSLFLFSFSYLLHRNYLVYSLFIIAASFFHTSVLLFLLLPVLNVVDWRLRLPNMIVYVALFVVGLNTLGFLYAQISDFLITGDSVYSKYVTQSDGSYGLGFLFNTGSALLVAFLLRNQDDARLNTTIKFALLHVTIVLSALAIQMTTRFLFYTFPILIIGYVMLLHYLRRKTLVRLSLQTLLLAFYAYQNYIFWFSDIWYDSFFEYRSLFSSSYF